MSFTHAIFGILMPLIVIFTGVCAIVAVARLGRWVYRTKARKIPDLAPLFSVVAASFMLWMASSYLATVDYGAAAFVVFIAGFPAFGGVALTYDRRHMEKVV